MSIFAIVVDFLIDSYKLSSRERLPDYQRVWRLTTFGVGIAFDAGVALAMPHLVFVALLGQSRYAGVGLVELLLRIPYLLSEAAYLLGLAVDRLVLRRDALYVVIHLLVEFLLVLVQFLDAFLVVLNHERLRFLLLLVGVGLDFLAPVARQHLEDADAAERRERAAYHVQ